MNIYFCDVYNYNIFFFTFVGVNGREIEPSKGVTLLELKSNVAPNRLLLSVFSEIKFLKKNVCNLRFGKACSACLLYRNLSNNFFLYIN